MEIKTFDNKTGPSVFFRALGHPIAAEKAVLLREKLARAQNIAVFDAENRWADFAALHDLGGLKIGGIFVQRLEDHGSVRGGRKVMPLADLPKTEADVVLALDFGSDRIMRQLGPVMPHYKGKPAELVSLDAVKLPPDLIGNPRNYLDPLNFAADFVLMREADGWHTRLATANYWYNHGGRGVKLFLCLFDKAGKILARWQENLPDSAATILIDSRDISQRFNLGEFCGSLFCHAIGAQGHNVVKYALDIYHEQADAADAELISCTHDANPFPADYYAGLPAPQTGEKVYIWLQNCHPVPIPPNAVTINRMGEEEHAKPIGTTIPPYGTAAIELNALFPNAVWPQQYELASARHVVRPRYEIIQTKAAANATPRRYIAHMNVERNDLVNDPNLPDVIGADRPLGRGYLLPAPILPLAEFESWALPTPMVRGEAAIPLKLTLFAANGTVLGQHQFGVLPRRHNALVGLSNLWRELAAQLAATEDYGHCEFSYDFKGDDAAAAGGNGWLHGLFRYQNRASGQLADTSFGAHLYNIPWSFKSEPQSYWGKPPGLSTRLFLRVDGGTRDTICHLIYPSSGGQWWPHSATDIILGDGTGAEQAKRRIEIPQSGSYFFRYHSLFTASERAAAGDRPQIIIRDASCRLFGFHGLTNQMGGFAFDHMFGF